MLPQTERLVLSLKVPRYLRPIICCLALLSQIPASPVEATWKYICDNKDKYLPHSSAARCLDFSLGQNSDLCRRAQKGFVKFLDLLYFCFADDLDFSTLWRCHLSVLGLLRNNCQFITQVGVA